MDTKHVSAAVAVAGYGSFTRAANETQTLQSTLSRQVGALERHLGTLLFHRAVGANRTLRLTETGRAFLPCAMRLLEEVRQAELAACGEHLVVSTGDARGRDSSVSLARPA